ncbi:glycosyltransferase [Jeotgalibaca porci]|uniref:glycosyltransferase n=1 Tax=Jeotgalibaca porci TaxID=1868793 RepID=UPI003F8DB8C7
MKTIMFPIKEPANPYIDMVSEAISSNSFELYDWKMVLKNRKLMREVQVANLNWFDTVRNCSFPKAFLILVRQIIYIYIMKINGIKIIYTMHNSQAHDTKYPRMNHFLMSFMSHRADRIAVLCTYSQEVLKKFLTDSQIEEKVRVVYHPTYKGIYPEEIKKIDCLSSNNKKMHVLFTGQIKRYKNIELILQIAEYYKGANIEFLIAGRPESDEYKKEIEKKCENNSNIRFLMRYIQDDEITTLYSWADVVLIPLSLSSSLNSGSAILSITQGKTVIAPLIGTLMDYPIEDLFTYQYKDEDQHLQAVIGAVGRAYSEWKENSQALKEAGQRLQEFAEENFSREKTRNRYKELYNELVNH